jgi:hypothetical protein
MLHIEKLIYGMAQAGRRWQRTIFPYLLRAGFKVAPSPTPSDPCVFIRRTETVQTPGAARATRP